jgi:hypothetical protein
MPWITLLMNSSLNLQTDHLHQRLQCCHKTFLSLLLLFNKSELIQDQRKHFTCVVNTCYTGQWIHFLLNRDFLRFMEQRQTVSFEGFLCLIKLSCNYILQFMLQAKKKTMYKYTQYSASCIFLHSTIYMVTII